MTQGALGITPLFTKGPICRSGWRLIWYTRQRLGFKEKYFKALEQLIMIN